MRTAIVSGLLLVMVAACDKQEAKDTAASASASATASAPAASSAPTPPAGMPSGTAAASASAAPSAALPKCPAGLTGNATPPFCIKVPASYSVKDARTSPTHGSLGYDTGTKTDNLMISYDETPVASQAKDVEGEMKFGGDKLEKKGDLPGGGKWFQGSHQDFERLVTLVKGPGTLIFKCSFAYQPKNAPPKDAIDACKSIVVPPG
ncbi:MAG: hypothetical protein ACRENE_03075 [Polyangiaceae bacterium]